MKYKYGLSATSDNEIYKDAQIICNNENKTFNQDPQISSMSELTYATKIDVPLANGVKPERKMKS